MTPQQWAIVLAVLCAILACITAALAASNHAMRSDTRTIEAALRDRLPDGGVTDSDDADGSDDSDGLGMRSTNTLIDLPNRNPATRRLASCLNRELALLRDERQRYQRGDMAIKQAITDAAHDLRTPLTAIRGYLDLMERESLPQDTRRHLRLISGRVDAMSQLTDELFQYSLASSETQVDKGDVQVSAANHSRERLDLRRAVEDVLAAYYPVLQARDITPSVTMPDEPVLVEASMADANRILANIVSNAARYSDGDLDVNLDANGTISFSNIATGLDPMDAARLLDRYVAVNDARNHTGTGLGLNIAQMLANRNHGTITIEYHDARLTVTISFHPAAA